MNAAGPTSAGPRSTLDVPALGISERAVLDSLGLSWDQLQPVYGREIGAPRDYVYRRHGPVFTAAGVQRLVAHFKLNVEVRIEGDAPADLPAHPQASGPRHFRGAWWEDFA